MHKESKFIMKGGFQENMNREKGPLDWLKSQLLGKKEESGPSNKKNGKIQYLVILLLCGVAFMLISSMWKSGAAESSQETLANGDGGSPAAETFGSVKDAPNKSMADYEKQYENQLKEALDQMAGVSSVTVVVNVEASEQKVFEKNTNDQNQITSESDRDGGQRKIENQTKDEQLVIIRNGEKEVPIVRETRKPEIKGVLIVAKGAENIQVKKWIIEAVTRVLDVPSHRVAVMPKK
ncbi:stage III sporulation protein AG [Falsibacillus pallidus]|uniref:Stage III sporulation protein AG n=2 Tax=Falsibacillus pallidus TaxID=493781 RepID=A0A370GDA1_9BACI|nr:stage III sporulation protein AG [Falsibacillus pallidus]